MKYNPIYAQVYERYHEQFTLGTAFDISLNEIEIKTSVITAIIPKIPSEMEVAPRYNC